MNEYGAAAVAYRAIPLTLWSHAPRQTRFLEVVIVDGIRNKPRQIAPAQD